MTDDEPLMSRRALLAGAGSAVGSVLAISALGDQHESVSVGGPAGTPTERWLVIQSDEQHSINSDEEWAGVEMHETARLELSETSDMTINEYQ